MLAAVSSVPAYAEGKVATAAANEARLNTLTAEYTKRYQLKQYAEAIPIAEQAVAMAEAAFGPNDEQVAQVECRAELGRTAQAHQHVASGTSWQVVGNVVGQAATE